MARDIEAHGGEINAWTSFDQTVFHLLGELFQDPFHAIPIHEVALEGDFLPDRLAFSCGFDWSVIWDNLGRLGAEHVHIAEHRSLQAPFVQVTLQLAEFLDVVA